MAHVNDIIGYSDDKDEQMSTLPEPEVLRQLIDYDPATGALNWKHRPREFFKTDGAYKAWNTRFAGEPCFDRLHKSGYKDGTIFGFIHSAHRVAWSMYYGKRPPLRIEFVNGVRSDTRIANLKNAMDITKRT